MAEEYIKKALLLSRDIGHKLKEFQCFCSLSVLKVSKSHLEEASLYLFQSIVVFDTLRGSLKDNDQFQTSLLEEHGTFSYKLFSKLLSSSGKAEDALYVQELRRARGLADMMAARYSVQEQISGNPQSWRGIQEIIKREADCACLYISIIIAPVASLLKHPEIIIVPDSCTYQVPFAALADEGGKYLSETCKIRMVSSLTTLKYVQNSPPDYHIQTGALIVGDPEVGAVIYKEKRRIITPLLCARKEAEMIGRLLGVTPLIGKSATKHAALQAINSVSLIHIAAHGDAKRGEIALSPEHLTLLPPFPREEDYLLTMADISKARLRAKLVVLSCCHSARGQIRTEGVIGIARAFVGSGARSVLAARWALDDTATEQFMTCFYKHLLRGESASESLHMSRDWMRHNGFDKISQWAPFMLMGDNVTFDFANWPVPNALQEAEAE
ncbi:Tetratricopeptide repeat protein 28 [Stylophora pistillata]|uniref:Tetratricopeptide repeat protein 28 n=1 Tax=Stylophora pistillata TaxID=50429 RepID=A0A2B4S2F9_STYPI|nr:Tetratricopeptide repeat protein 28 [Stylophora pistillata]